MVNPYSFISPDETHRRPSASLRGVRTLIWLLLTAALALAEGRPRRWAIVLTDPPLAEAVVGKNRAAASEDHRRRIQTAQASVRSLAESRGARFTGAIQTLANAVFVRATEEQAEELRHLPGVAGVQEMLPLRRHMDRAAGLVNAPAAWNTVGGESQAGAGVKIGILDTGIDQTHAAFQDQSLSRPPGFPLCRGSDCDFTNNKVIVARSYVQMLVLADIPEDSRPDDLSPRDRVGHGTAAAMVAAGVRNTGPAGTIAGIAPKAFLGNYKIFGSPGVNDVTFDDVLLQALDDAFRDGMNVVSLSIGRSALWGPKDAGSICDLRGSEACDLRADAVERAAQRGMTIVVSAGNDGDLGLELPTLNSVHSPGTAPSAITVGATANAHLFYSSVRAASRRFNALLGNGPKPDAALTAPLRNVATLGDNGRACAPLANGSLAGAIALIERGDCSFATKVRNAQAAGALAALIYQQTSNFLFPPTGLAETAIPAALIGGDAGRDLKNLLASNSNTQVTLDPALTAVDDPDVDTVAYFSSQGPGLPDTIQRPQEVSIKPELVAPGTGIYTATQKYDPNGDMYDPTGYTAAQGTSFSAPMVAGAVALVKQRNPNFTAAQLKSAVVNTADNNIGDFDFSGRPIQARVTGAGAGKLNAGSAVRSTVTAEPSTLAYGVIRTGSLPISRTLRLTNTGTSSAQLRLADSNRRLNLNPSSLTLNGGASSTVSISLQGSVPSPGAYEGAITVDGGATPLRIPYLYLVGDNQPHNIIPLRGFDFVGVVSTRLPGRLTFKVIDQYGVPVQNLPVRFGPTLGDGSIQNATASTDELGIAEANEVTLGPRLGEQEFGATAGQLSVYFPGKSILRPTIRTGGVVNAASLLEGQGQAPGSYITIFGRGLSESFRVFNTGYLPLSLAGVSVSFDVPAQKLSLPGRIHFVSDEQINVQVPWELEGLNSVQVKVSIGDFSSALYELRLAEVSPAFFEYTEPSTGRRLLAALDTQFRVLGSSNPIRRDGIALLYANGLGKVTNQPPTGEPTPAEPLPVPRVQPEVTIGGQRAEVLGSALAPFNVALYQINVRIPGGLAAGVHEVVIRVNGVASKAANLVVE